MIFRNYLGLDIGQRELRAVSLRRKGTNTKLAGGRILTLEEGILLPSVKDENIRDPRRLAEEIQEVLGPLDGREERIALSLPESAGRILLTEVETAFRSKAEGEEILKWQMKGVLPFEAREAEVDYQVLERRENGRFRLVVAVIARKVLHQYEEVCRLAGYGAAMVDFHSLNLYNYYRPRLDLGEDFFLVGLEGGTLTLQFFEGRLLAFQRSREIAAQPEHVFQELARSLVGCQESHPGFRRAAVFVHSDWRDMEPLLAAVRTAFEREVILLDPHLERLNADTSDFSASWARRLVAAVGAAERMM